MALTGWWCERVQVAHFFEADLQPWAITLVAAVTVDDLKAAKHSVTRPYDHYWDSLLRRRLDELAPVGDTLDMYTVLRAARLPLGARLPWTLSAGELSLDGSDAAAACGVMHVLPGLRRHACAPGPRPGSTCMTPHDRQAPQACGA